MPRTCDPAVLEIIASLYAQAQAGQIDEIFVVTKLVDGQVADDWHSNDVADMTYEVRTSLFRFETSGV